MRKPESIDGGRIWTTHSTIYEPVRQGVHTSELAEISFNAKEVNPLHRIHPIVRESLSFCFVALSRREVGILGLRPQVGSETGDGKPSFQGRACA